MAQTGLEQDKQLMKKKKYQTEEQRVVLKGTLVSVMILGSLIIVTWFAMFALFMSRQ